MGYIIRFNRQFCIESRKEDINKYYEIDTKKTLGAGAFGVTFRARLKNSDEWRAIKRIDKKKVLRKEALQNEIDILAVIDHPTCIRLYESFEDSNYLYLVTDFCAGGELFEQLMKINNFSEKDARTLFRQIIEAISYCHAHHIAHRDLKPENFMLMTPKSLELKMIDFGMAFKWNTNMRQELKAKGEKGLIGTAYYIAPQVIFKEYDERCDIWSAGVLLYILLTAIPPFNGDNDDEILDAVKKMKYDFNIPEMDNVSPQAKNLIRRLLQPDVKRITISEIFCDPWFNLDLPSTPLVKLNFQKIKSYSKISYLKRIVAMMLASQLPQKDVVLLGNQFRAIDLNHDGQITLDELAAALARGEVNMNGIELKKLMSAIDSDESNSINFTEFVAFFMERKIYTEERLKMLFKKIDTDQNGEVEKEELKKLLKVEKWTNNQQVIDQIVDALDKDKSGSISFEEFKAAVLGM